MGANLVYLDRPNTKKNTIFGQVQPQPNTLNYKYACSAMQGWRLNMVSPHCKLFQTCSSEPSVFLILGPNSL